MSTYVYIAASSERRLLLGSTKVLDLTRLSLDEQLGDGHRIVFAKACPTALDAVAELAKLKKMAMPRRLRLVEKHNPAWRDVCELAESITVGIVEATTYREAFGRAAQTLFERVAAAKRIDAVLSGDDRALEELLRLRQIAREQVTRMFPGWDDPPSGTGLAARIPIDPVDPVRTRNCADSKPLPTPGLLLCVGPPA